MKLVKSGLGIMAAAAITAMLPVGVGGLSSAVAQQQSDAEICPADGSEITCVYFPSSGITWCYISKCGPG